VNLKDIEGRIDKLLTQAETALRNVQRGQTFGPSLRPEEWATLRSAGLAFIESTFGRGHSYYAEFEKQLADDWESSGKQALGILKAIRDDIKGGWLETTKGLVSAEVFADFLEMAEHLLDQKYKDPAAVLVGSVLEEHLRQLCATASVPVVDHSHGKSLPRKADSLNADLAKVGKYTVLDQKQVTAWLDLRNRAAHGKYSEYTDDQVRLMLEGVTNFISRIRP
jgi:hypothetical protein